MKYHTIENLKPEAQRDMLRDLCKQISELKDDMLQLNGEPLLIALVEVLEEQSQDDAWGTEGWQHYFGYGA